MQAFIPFQNAKGIVVPQFIFSHEELSIGAKLLFANLGAYARHRNYCYPSKSKLMKDLKCSLNTLKSWIKQLVSSNFVEIRQTEYGETYFLFCPPDICNHKNNDVSKTDKKLSNFDSQVSNFDSSPLSKSDSVNNINLINKINTPPLTPQQSEHKRQRGWDSEVANQYFEKLWDIYPKKEAKECARKVCFSLFRMGKIPNFAEIKSAISSFYQSYSWQREHGRFIPQLANFLKGMRWKDIEIKPITPQTQTTFSTEAPIYKLHKREICVEQKKRTEVDEAFATFKRFFAPLGKIHECLALITFEALYLQGKIPNLLENQKENLLNFLQNINMKKVVI